MITTAHEAFAERESVRADSPFSEVFEVRLGHKIGSIAITEHDVTEMGQGRFGAGVTAMLIAAANSLLADDKRVPKEHGSGSAGARDE